MNSGEPITLETEEGPGVQPQGTVPGPAPMGGPGVSSSPGGVTPSAPAMAAPTTFDGIFEQIAAQALAPFLGFLGAITGNPMGGGETGGGGGGGGAASSPPVSSGAGAAGAVSVNDPNARALLHAIADAEGTTKYPNNGYNTMFTGKQFSSLKDHPRAIQGGSGLRSDAAGRYQFLSTTWDEYAKGRDMSPANQDAVALELVAKKRGVDISDGLSKQEVYKLGAEWASIEGGPNAVPGGGYGGQAKYTADVFLQMYKAYGGKVQGLQQGGMVGSQINMKGIQNAHMARLRESQQRMRRKGPKIVQVTLPPMPQMQTAPVSEDTGSIPALEHGMKMSQLADFNRRIAMGALA